MPTEQCVGVEDEEHRFPFLDATSEEDEPEAIGLRNGRCFDLTAQDNQLLAEQIIFGHAVGFVACQVGDRAENNRMAGGLGEVQESLFKKRNETAEQLGQPMKGSEHAVGLRESCQKLSNHFIQRSRGVKSQRDGVFSQHTMVWESNSSLFFLSGAVAAVLGGASFSFERVR